MMVFSKFQRNRFSKKLQFRLENNLTSSPNYYSRYRCFSVQLLSNVLVLNKMLYQFGILQDLLCSFRSLEQELQCIYSTVVIIHKFFEKDLSII